jgi:hypothetical protein
MPRRNFSQTGSAALSVHMRSRDNGANVTFDPIGVLVQPGTFW